MMTTSLIFQRSRFQSLLCKKVSRHDFDFPVLEWIRIISILVPSRDVTEIGTSNRCSPPSSCEGLFNYLFVPLCELGTLFLLNCFHQNNLFVITLPASRQYITTDYRPIAKSTTNKAHARISMKRIKNLYLFFFLTNPEKLRVSLHAMIKHCPAGSIKWKRKKKHEKHKHSQKELRNMNVDVLIITHVLEVIFFIIRWRQ